MVDFSIGSVVEFRYHGGTIPGATRIVAITTHNTTGIGGVDLETGEYRNFNYRHMSETRELPSTIVDLGVFFGMAKTNVRKSYTDAYVVKGYKVVQYGDKLYCYKPSTKFVVEFLTHSVKFNANNKTVTVSRDFVDNDFLTIDNLIKALQSLKS